MANFFSLVCLWTETELKFITASSFVDGANVYAQHCFEVGFNLLKDW